MYKINKNLVLMTSLIIMLLLFACGRKGKPFTNNGPTISITSYEGVEDSTALNDTITFQQKIYWSASDNDGVVTGYAYRVLEEDGVTPRSTLGHDAIDAAGWVYHYLPGVEISDQTPPLDSPEAADIRDIWSDEVYTVINFPANGEITSIDSLGNPIYAPITSTFEVKCIDNRGRESEISRKYFNTSSVTPISNLLTDLGDKVVGTGLLLEFSSQNIDGINSSLLVPHHFEFALLKATIDHIDNDGTKHFIPAADDYNLVKLNDDGSIDFSDDSNWLTTEHCPNIEQFKIPNKQAIYQDLMLKENIPLESDPVEASAVDTTYIFFKMVNLANIDSKVKEKKFYVYGGYHPATIAYLKDSFILGEYHYQPYYESGLGRVIPSELTSTGVHYSTPFWKNLAGEYEVIGSDNIKFYMHWGWGGEFASENPWLKKNNDVFDENTDNNYFSSIEYFDVRLDGAPIFYPPLPTEGGENLSPDGNWLRIPKSNPVSQEFTLAKPALMHNSVSGLYGHHVLEIRAVDLQDVADSTPVVIEFNVVHLIPKENRTGIFVINDCQQGQFSAADSVNALYREYLSDYSGQVDIVVRDSIEIDTDLHFSKDALSPTDLQKYQLVIYVQDYPAEDYNFAYEYDALSLYMATGGNLILSGGKNIQKSYIDCYNSGFLMMQDFFGLSFDDEESVDFLSDNLLVRPWFVRAVPEEGYNAIDVRLPTLSWQPPLINTMNGLAPIAYFNKIEPDAEVIYTLGCKEPDTDNHSPNEEDYAEFNGKTVAIKKTTENGSGYLFGFPLAYMQTDHVKTFFNKIFTDIGLR